MWEEQKECSTGHKKTFAWLTGNSYLRHLGTGDTCEKWTSLEEETHLIKSLIYMSEAAMSIGKPQGSFLNKT